MRSLRAHPRRYILISLLAVSVLMLGLALSRDTRPPEVYAELPQQVLVGDVFEVRLSANKPVHYTLSYAGEVLEETAQDSAFELTAASGRQTLELHAVDTFGNEASYRFEVFGMPELRPLVQVPREAVPGAPISVRIAHPPEMLAPVTTTVRFDGEPLRVFEGQEDMVALSSVPLGGERREHTIEVTLRDGFDREVTLTRTLHVLPEVHAVQELNVAGSVLAAVTPENVALERDVVDDAYASTQHPDAPLWSEPFKLPAEGRFTSPYGLPRRYSAGGRVSYHHGTDIAAPEGTPIQATNKGRVMTAQFLPIKGGFTIIDHGSSVFSFYLHQSRIHVEPGQLVERGEVIGEIGTTGLSTGPHLHWEMRVNTISTDPMSWVDRVLP